MEYLTGLLILVLVFVSLCRSPRFGTTGIADSWLCASEFRLLAWGSVRSVLYLGDDCRNYY